MSKKRKVIWDKSNGKCWYCGCGLGENGWHADHFKPVIRKVDGTMRAPENDVEENMVPACGSCNRMKGRMSIDSFRKIIEGFVNSLNRDSTQYKFSKRYGLVEETHNEVEFWFEKQGL